MPTVTARQEQVVRLVASGRSNKQIATELGISERAVKALVSRLLEKFSAPNRAGLIASFLTDPARSQGGIAKSDYSAYRDAPFLIAVLAGPTHRYVFVSDKYERASGRSVDQLLGQPLRQAFPGVVESEVALLDTAFTTGIPSVGCIRRPAIKDVGSTGEVLFDTVVQPLWGAGGQVEGVLMIASEVPSRG